jgi:3-hydroxyisobutyrate dehydrogenase-like beta-hydroxyacid dehydrogenase
MLSSNPRIGFVGFGEVGFHLSKGLRQAGVEKIVAYDKGLVGTAKGEKVRRSAGLAGVQLVPTLEELVTQSELVISSAHARAALEIAKEAAQYIHAGAMFADLNNVMPSVKKKAAELINASGASFVDIGLLEIPALTEHKALMYVSGNGAKEFEEVMSKFGMNIEVTAEEAGQAATIKALMNIYLKGMQALSIEVALSAYKADIPINLLSLLVSKMVANVPDENEMAFWIERGMLHAGRKTAEVKDLMEMMKEWGIDAVMMEATVRRLDATAQYNLPDYVGENPYPDGCQSMLEVMEKIGTERGIGLR